MFKWAKDMELIDLECGNIEDVIDSREQFKEGSMSSYIHYNAEAKASFCHFGIPFYKK